MRPAPAKLDGKTAVVTGARIVLVAHHGGRAEVALAGLAPSARLHEAYVCDLSSMRQTAAVGREIAAALPCVDILVNNAGALFSRRVLTDEGLERTFALNHMSYFILTTLLLPSLAATGAGRVVSTASSSYKHAKLDFGDLQGSDRLNFAQAYAKSKLCNVLWTRELARRLAGMTVVANCFHPGLVASRFGEAIEGGAGLAYRAFRPFAVSPERGAATAVFLASDDAAARLNGSYLEKGKVVAPTAPARDMEVAARLWRESERIAAEVLA